MTDVTVSADAIMTDIRKLASDEFEGRLPGTKGETLTVQYLIDQFKAIGLQPGNPDGTFTQKVPLVGISGGPSPLVVKKGAATRTFKVRDDFVAFSKHVVDEVTLENSELVFAGYGVQAPEYQWDDFKGVDIKGKTIIVLVNDPPVADPANPQELDSKTFGGKAMTYYGRWTYKFEKAAELGAAAVLIVHETIPAAYPWTVVQTMGGERFDLVTPDKNAGRSKVEGWISMEAATALLKMAGQDYQKLKAAARTNAFKAVPLGMTASLSVKQKLRTVDSQNVIAKLPGTDPRLKDEYVIYTAHWDHFGVGEPIDGDRIYNGAKDNATGTAALLETARAFTRLPKPPRRSILFLAVTAE
jgi:Zn-dependent M28 family amino/carboxypeptidase